MNFFKLLYGLLAAEITMTIVIRKNENGRLCVSTSFTTEKGTACDGLVPFLLKGTPEEMDEGFIDAIRQPVEQVSGLVSNYKQFEEAAKQAKENMTKKQSPSVSSANAQKEAEERKRKEELKKQDYKTLLTDIENAEKNFKYHTAEALITLAENITSDYKEKNALAKRKATATNSKDGLMCADTADDAKAAVDAFKKMQTDRENDKTKTATADKQNPKPKATDTKEKQTESEETAEETVEENTEE